jgi:hypothetical protein
MPIFAIILAGGHFICIASRKKSVKSCNEKTTERYLKSFGGFFSQAQQHAKHIAKLQAKAISLRRTAPAPQLHHSLFYLKDRRS